MSNVSANVEERLLKIERSLKENYSTTGVVVSHYPVRKLALAEELSYGDTGTAVSVIAATWEAPAGGTTPSAILVKVTGKSDAVLDGSKTEYRVSGFTAGDTITVAVYAVYTDGTSAAATASITISGEGTEADPPTNLTATGGYRCVDVKWTQPSSETHKCCEIWHSTDDANIETASKIAIEYGSEFVHSNLSISETHWYWVRAVDTGGNYSEFAGPVSATTDAAIAAVVSDGSITEAKLADSLFQAIEETDGLFELTQKNADAQLVEQSIQYIKHAENEASIKTEQTTRADADTAMAAQITTVSAQTSKVSAAIQTIEQVKAGAVTVYDQTSAPTSGMSEGDLWKDDNDAYHRYDGSAWVSVSDTDLTALLNWALSEYTVKVQATYGDKPVFAGFGLRADSTGDSEFCIAADKFYIYGASAADGQKKKQIFAIGQNASGENVLLMNGSMIATGTITGHHINAESEITLEDGGKLIIGDDGILQIADGAILLNSENGTITVKDPDNLTTGDYVQMETGDITTYKYIDGAYRGMKSLRKMYAGQGVANNSTVTIPGYWPSQPEIIVSPCNIKCYDKNYSGQDQTLEFQATDVTYNSSTGIVTFKPVARLLMGAGSGSSGSGYGNSVSQTSSCSSASEALGYISISSQTVTIPAGCSSVTASVNVSVSVAYNSTASGTPHYDREGVVDYVTYYYYRYSGTPTIAVKLVVDGVEYTAGSFTGSSTTTSDRTVNLDSSTSHTMYAKITVTNCTWSSSHLGSSSSPTSYRSASISFASYSFQGASAATTLANGTLNYVAIAE